ncbi:MAG TPA: ABC transporter permease [Tepidiformaceae bacterium]|nr:ABC transporter permease [Tepidiformaceae bacterium]
MATQASARSIELIALPRERTRLRRLGRTARQHPAGVFGFFVLVIFVIMGVFGPYISPYGPNELRVGTPLAGPSLAHPMGLNQNGQDILSRIIAGARVSLIISSAAIFIGASLGSFLGILAGYYGRWVDYIVQRSGEAFAAFPTLVLYFMLRAAFGPGMKPIILAIAIGALFGGNRVLRGQTIIESRSMYVEAARSVGCSEWRIFLRHVMPNVLPLVVVIMSGALGAAILAESALAFLGLGVEEASWGRDMSGSNLSIARTGYWHVVVFPGLMISLVVLGANLLGDSLRDIWDPRLRH